MYFLFSGEGATDLGSPNSLKGELERLLGEPATRELLLRKIEDGSIDCHRITMPSFLSFRERLEEVM